MRRLIIGGIVLIFSSCNTYTDTSQKEAVSLSSISPVKVIQNPLKEISTASIKSEREAPIIGKSVEVNISSNDFNCVEGKGKILCSYSIVFEGGKGGRIHFKDVSLENGMKVFITDSDEKAVQEVNYEGWTPDLLGNKFFIYYTYLKGKKKPSFTIDKVIYTWQKPYEKENINIQGIRTECPSRDVACETDKYDKGKWKYVHSSSMYTFTDGRFLYQCSGNLIENHSNSSEDPIFITSAHCIDSDKLAETATFWFDFRDRHCNSYDGKKYRYYVQGAKVLDVSDMDISLLQITGNLHIDKHRYTWLKWDEDSYINPNYEVFGISYPKENPAMFHAGYISQNCYIQYNKNFHATCGTFKVNGFKVNWHLGSVDLGSSGSALLYPFFDKNEKEDWKIIGILAAKTSGCNPPTGIYSNFFTYINKDKNAYNILRNGLPDDYLEENDSPEDATARLDNSLSCNLNKKFKDLVVKNKDEDWYILFLPRDCKLIVKPTFDEKSGHVKVQILDSKLHVLSSKNDNDDTVEYKESKGRFVYIRTYIEDNTYQRYNLRVQKLKVGNAHLSVSLNEDSNYINDIMYTFSVDIQSDKYRPEDFKVCLSLEPYMCNYWFRYRKQFKGFVGFKEREYNLYVFAKDPEGRLTNVEKISVYRDITPPYNGSIFLKKQKNGILIRWGGFRDNMSGIKRYKVVYSDSPVENCNQGTILYEGTENEFLHEINNKKTKYYRVCAQDYAGNWSSGVIASIK